MPKLRYALLLVPVLALALLAGCGSDDSSDADDGGAVTAADCTPEKMETITAGKLTVGTDSPAYPPYFVDDDPSNGKGFESAVAYAIADQLGYDEADVEWVDVPFNSSFAPGPKDFDFDVNQISITPQRAQAVDFSEPYYEANQAIVVKKGSDLDGATSLADFQDATLGVQLGTTSLEAVEDQIDPGTEPKVFNDSNDVVTAFKQDQVDAVVVDLPTALYLTAVQVPDSTVAGQFAAPGGDEWGAVLDKDSSLTGCVDAAIEALDEDGTLEQLESRWMSKAAGAPELG